MKKKAKSTNIVIALSLPREMEEHLSKAAKKRYTSLSTIVRQAIAEWLETNGFKS